MSTAVDKSVSIPRYRQLKDLICQEIRQENLQPGKKIGSVAKLATRHKLSRTTIVKALSELIDEGVLYSEIGNGTFVADPAGKKTHTICFVVYSGDYITLPYFSQIVAGISNVAEAEHYKLQFVTSARAVQALDGRSPYPSLKERKWADGLIIMDNLLEDEQVIRLAEELPVVLINRKIPGADVACVRVDDSGGTYQAISYLAGLGHRRIGMIVGSKQWQTDREKLLGYRSAVDDLGLEVEDGLVVSHAPDPKGERLRTALDTLLGLAAPPTAIFVGDDVPAFTVFQILQEKGKRVPEDFAVMGFSGCLHGVLRLQPITTMQLPITEMGVAAAKMLLALIGQREVVSREAVFTPKLVIRQSCGGKEAVQPRG